MHALRALVPLALLLASCAGPSQTSRYRAMTDAWERAALPAPDAEEDPFAGAATLERERVIRTVLARNPTLEAARWAWRAALARHPQATSLEDPMFAYELAPRSIGSSDVDTGQGFVLTQPFPFPGKLALRGEIALAEAEAAAGEHAAVRLRLATLASLGFDDYFLAAREIEINDAHRALVAELRELALARYAAGMAAQQDALEAELEETTLLHRDAVLRASLHIAAERLNVLMRRDPDRPLPPPPAALLEPAPSEPRDVLLDRARAERPDLGAADARVAAREAAVGLARREYLPDFELMGGYVTIMQEDDLQPRVGLALNLPLQLARRRGAVDEAEAALERARSERIALADTVRFDVERTLARLAEARHGLMIVRDRRLPAASDRAVSARSAFESGERDFSTVIDAERDLRDAELAYQEAQVEVSRLAAELARATGALPGAIR